MMGTRERLKGGFEWDYLTVRSRRVHKKKAGLAKGIKRRFWRRVRKARMREALDFSS